MNRIALLLLAALLIAPVGAAWAETPIKGGTLITAMAAEPPGLDPTANTAAAIDRVVWSNLFETLIKTDDNGKLVPGLAESWTVSPCGKIYTFKLAKTKFHNGQIFNAGVAKFNLELYGKVEKNAEGKVTKKFNIHPEYFSGIASIETLGRSNP